MYLTFVGLAGTATVESDVPSLAEVAASIERIDGEGADQLYVEFLDEQARDVPASGRATGSAGLFGI